MEDIEAAYEEIKNRNISPAPASRNFRDEDREAEYGSFRYVHKSQSHDGNGRQKVLYGEAEIQEPYLPHDRWRGFETLALMAKGFSVRDSAIIAWEKNPKYLDTNPKARDLVEGLEEELGENGKFVEGEREDLDELLWNEVYEESETQKAHPAID